MVSYINCVRCCGKIIKLYFRQKKTKQNKLSLQHSSKVDSVEDMEWKKNQQISGVCFCVSWMLLVFIIAMRVRTIWFLIKIKFLISLHIRSTMNIGHENLIKFRTCLFVCLVICLNHPLFTSPYSNEPFACGIFLSPLILHFCAHITSKKKIAKYFRIYDLRYASLQLKIISSADAFDSYDGIFGRFSFYNISNK